MRACLPALLVAASLAACGFGDNARVDPSELGLGGGSLVPPGCDHVMRTRLGVEPPALSGAELGPDPSVRQVRLGLPADPRTTIAVTWRTADDATRAGKVRFGIDGLTDEAPGLTFAYATDFGGVGPWVRVHEAHLCGLRPDTTYQYQVVSDDAHVSPIYSFRTAPDVAASPDAEVVLGAVGDSRDGYPVWARLVEQLRARQPDLIVFTGDAVTIGVFQDEWDEFFTAGEPLFARVPVVSAHGNHELNAPGYYAQLAMPGDEEDFGFDYGHAHVTVVNDTPEQVGDLEGRTRTFLVTDLRTHARARWRIVAQHRSLYSASSHGSDATLQAAWGPVYDAGRVDLALSGHDHNYERSRPMRAGEVQAAATDGTTYVVTGGAGAELYDAGTAFHTAVSRKTYSATLIRIRATLLELTAFDPDGALVDATLIVKP